MRFKEIECFNRAMLAKQGWRMMQESYLLAACIYKEKYFKNSQLLEAMLGNFPSLIWRSTWFFEGCIEGWVKVESGEWPKHKDLGSEVVANTYHTYSTITH